MEDQQSNFRWLVLVLLFLIYFFIFTATNCIPPLFKEIGNEIALTKAGMGMIMGVITLPSLFFSLLGGAISDKVGSRWAIGSALIIISLSGAVRATVESHYGLTVCMFLIGVGVAILGPNVPKVLGMWFPPKELATANGICMIGMPLAGTFAMGTAAGVLSPAFGGWRNVMVVLGAFPLMLGLLWLLLYRDRKVEKALGKRERSILENFKEVFRIKDVWWASAFMGLNMIGVMSVIALLPHSLSERGMTEVSAGGLVAIMFGMSSAFKIVGGFLSDRVGKRIPFIFISSIVQGICVIAFAFSTGIPLIIALAIAGVAMGVIPPVFMVIPVEIKEIGPALAATAMGLIFMIGNSGSLVGPVVAGKLMDFFGGQLPGFLFMGVAIIIGGFCILFVRETGQRKKTSMMS